MIDILARLLLSNKAPKIIIIFIFFTVVLLKPC